MKKKLLALLLAAVLALSLLPTAALADAVERPVITNYEELVAAENSTETYYFVPKAEFGWPEEPTEVSITADLRMSSGGSWVIPEQATVNLSGKLQQDRSTPASVTVNGTLNLIDKMLLSVHQITIAGTLMVSGTSVTIGADEGEALSTATFNLIPVTDTTHSKLVFYQGPKYTPTHWVFHEGITFLGADPSKYSIGDLGFRDGLFETEGTVRSQYALYSYGAAIKGDWIFSQINVNGSGLTVDGSVSCRYLNASAGLTIPEGSTFAVELWEEAPGYSSSLNTSRGAEILVNGTLRMGRQLNVKLNGNGPIVGTGVVDARANNSWGNQQPVFLVDGTGIKVDDIDWDRAAYADLIAESLTIQKSWATRPALTKPASVTVNAGEEAVFSVEAKYTDAYQWFYKTSADSTESFPCTDAMGTGTNTNTFRLVAKPEYDGYVFFCRGYNSESSHSSAAATLTVLGPSLEITAQPQDYVGKLNSTATFTVAAEGDGLTYQWQISDDGENWTNSSVKTAKYSTKLTVAKNGRQVRCVVTDEAGNSLTSDAAVMKLSGPAITTQPKDYTGKLNSTATFTVAAVGEGLTYQWQVSDNDGSNWTNSSVKTAKYSTKLTAARDGRQVRCIVTDAEGNKATSNVATMKLQSTGVTITTQPKDYTGKVNSTASFTVVATGDGLTYQWQISDDNGKTWTNSSVKKAVYTTKLTTAKNGRQVRCIVTDANGSKATSTAATMKLAGPVITTQPKNYVGKVNSTASFTVVAEGNGLTYQWQVSDDDGATWSNSSVKKAVYTSKLTTAKDGRMVRCIVTDAEGNAVTTNAVTMKIG